MIPLRFRQRIPDLVALGAVAYGGFIWLVLPAGVTALNDDFGYLRSVVATLQHGRPWTDDWLEPWAAGLSGLAALTFWLTGSFLAATHGVLALCGAAAFWAGGTLLKKRGLAAAKSAGVTALLLTFPPLLWKSVEFTGVALYVPCLLLALLAAERRRWGWFCAVWLLAVATRQSAIVWVVLPLAEILEATWRRRPTWRAPAVVMFAGAVAFAALHLGMNQTHAQIMVTNHEPGQFIKRLLTISGLLQTVKTCALGTGLALLAIGLGANAVAGRPEAPGRLARRFGAIAALGLVGCFGSLVFQESDGLRGFSGTLTLVATGSMALIGWVRSAPWKLRWSWVAGAAASVVVVSSRDLAWDYYFLEAALLGFFAVIPTKPPITGPDAIVGSHLERWTLRLLVAGLVVGEALFALNLKLQGDRANALIRLAETARRTGKLGPDELRFAPGGFVGWHLFPYYIAHEGRDSAFLIGYRDYLRPLRGAVAVEQRYSPILHAWPSFRDIPPPHGGVAIGRVSFRCAWFFRGDLTLVRIGDAARPRSGFAIEPADYHPQPFPLDDAEWRNLIRGRPITK